MMHKRLRRALWACGTGIVLSLSAIAALSWQGQATGAQHRRYADALKHADHLHVQLNEQVAASQMGFVHHFDDLVRTWDALDQTHDLLAEPPPFLYDTDQAAIREMLADVSITLADKGRRLERFKTDRAVVRTAEQALPTSAARMRAHLAPDDPAQAALSRAVSSVLLTGLELPQPQAGDGIRCDLQHLAPRADDLPCAMRPPLSLAPEAANAATAVRRLGTVLLTRRDELDVGVRELMALPISDQLDIVRQRYDVAYIEAAQGQVRRLQVAWGLLAVVIALGAGLIVARLSTDARVLRRTRDKLEEAVTALRLERDREAELAALKSRFLAMSSHEFRTPLSVILSSAELLDAYGARWDEARRHKHLTRIAASSRAMTAMVDRLLVIGKGDADLLRADPSPVDLASLAGAVVEEVLTGEYAERSIQVDGGSGPIALLDATLVRHILSNLLTNALKYSPEDTVPSLLLTNTANEIRFEVADEGIGIPADACARVFEPFQRADNVPGIPGTGLGLAIVARAAEAHGGSVDVHSEVGVGTKFTVVLPLHEHRRTA